MSTYFDITVKRTNINIDNDDLETLINILGDNNIQITDCDDYTIPDFILSLDIADILEYIENCEKLGTGYELWCDNHHTYITEDDFNSNFRGQFSSYYLIVEDYLDNYELPPSIINSIDYEKLCNELSYTILESDNNFYVFTE